MTTARFAAAAVAAALTLAPAASASIWPAPSTGRSTAAPATYDLRTPRTHAAKTTTRACTTTAIRSRAARWLAPVACEQPPRSEVLVVPLLGG